jgi:hypothetical protein
VSVCAIVRGNPHTRAPGSPESCRSGVRVRRCLSRARRLALTGNRVTAVMVLIFLHVICLVPRPGRRPVGGQAAPCRAGRKRPTASLPRQERAAPACCLGRDGGCVCSRSTPAARREKSGCGRGKGGTDDGFSAAVPGLRGLAPYPRAGRVPAFRHGNETAVSSDSCPTSPEPEQ